MSFTSSMLQMAGPLVANQNPTVFDSGLFGKVYISGVGSGLALWQTNATADDPSAQADVSNGQIVVQKTDGVVRFFVQAGVYSFPSLGTPYVNAWKTTRDLYGPVPQAFIKLVPNEEWSVLVGKLPSLVGLEYTFTFQNMNIERGLLWNPTSSVSRGVQVNYSAGPITLAFSWNDGFYSGQPTWLSGSATWTVDSNNALTFVGASNTRTSAISTTATPLLQNNAQFYDIILAHTSGSWTVSPYLQFIYLPRSLSIGVLHDAAVFGAALLANYTFDSAAKVGDLSLAGFSLPIRGEYTTSTGNETDGSPNLLYGPGSSAWSITVTPTYRYSTFFTRAEFSYVGTHHAAAGFAFGPDSSNTTQARFVLERRDLCFEPCSSGIKARTERSCSDSQRIAERRPGQNRRVSSMFNQGSLADLAPPRDARVWRPNQRRAQTEAQSAAGS